MPADELERRRLAHRRLRGLHLRGQPAASPAQVVGRLGAMQAQEYAYARWSIAQRSLGLDLGAVEAALVAGEVLRTHVLRPTWHFLAAADIRWVLALSAPRVQRASAHSYRVLDLDARTLAAGADTIAADLAGGHHRTRAELRAVLEAAGIPAAGLRLAFILMNAELEALICSGAMRGRQQTYALLAERAPGARERDPDEALGELTRRYFTTRGPATAKDFSRWASLPLGQVRRGLEMIAAEVEGAEVGGREYWSGAGSAARPLPSPRVDLVQCYDEYVMSYTESRDVLAAPGRPLPVTDRDTYYHAILLDGSMVGRWRHALRGDGVTVEAMLYRRLIAGERQALDAEVARYGAFHGLAASLTIKP
ncbi:MAG: hypothetical protein QOE92_1759 [Chloroflexota bacterium]|jgi:hypothetical protein|nr:hypothetical protein [Chloroflexota bacterium]